MMKKGLLVTLVVLLIMSETVLAMGEKPRKGEQTILPGKLVATSLKTKGLYCSSCEIAVKKSLMKLAGMKMALVSYKDNKAVIFSEKKFSNATLAQAIEKAGYKLLAVESLKAQETKITARNFKFSPNQIDLELGRPVRLILSSLDGVHNIDIHDFGIEQNIPIKGSTIIEFVPLKRGEFDFYCNVPGHKTAGMKGKIIVK